MAPKGVEVVAVVVLVSFLVAGAAAQSGCTSVILSMASCLNYVTGAADAPPASCCSSLDNVVKTQPRCLCTIVNGGGGSLGVNINQSRALGLPSACKIDTPPVSRCNADNGPAMSPVGSPEGAPPESADGTPGSPSVTGSKTVPSGTSNGSKTKTTVVQFVANTVIFFVTASFYADFSNIF